MDLEVVPDCDIAESEQFVERVNRADLAGQRQRENIRPGVVDVRAFGGKALHAQGIHLAVVSRGQKELGPVGEKLRSPAFIRLNMRNLVADHAVIGLAERGQGERVRRRAVEDKEHFAIRLENLAKQFCRAAGDRVVSVGREIPGIAFLQRLPRLRANPRGVVTGKGVAHGGQ